MDITAYKTLLSTFLTETVDFSINYPSLNCLTEIWAMEQCSGYMMTLDKGVIPVCLKHNMVRILGHLSDCDLMMSHEICW